MSRGVERKKDRAKEGQREKRRDEDGEMREGCWEEFSTQMEEYRWEADQSHES